MALHAAPALPAGSQAGAQHQAPGCVGQGHLTLGGPLRHSMQLEWPRCLQADLLELQASFRNSLSFLFKLPFSN